MDWPSCRRVPNCGPHRCPEVAGRRALRVELTDAVTLEGRPGVDCVDMPTFVIIPATFTNGTVEVDTASPEPELVG
jgi:hypothetical protein